MAKRTAFFQNWLSLFLTTVERVGNALPHPATLFALFAVGVVFVSGIASMFDLVVKHPGTGAEIRAVSLMTLSGLHRILTGLVTNYTNFAPLGTVLVAMLGVGVMEGSGLIGASLRQLVLAAPPRLLTFAIVFAGVLSNMASEIGYVLLVPLAGIIFLGAGRNPMAGMAAGFAGVSGGYSANLLLGTVDPLLAGLSEEAARIVDPGYHVNPACNYYFMSVSTFLISFLGTWVTEKIIVPRLGAYTGDEKREEATALTADERRGLRFALVGAIVFTVFLVWSALPLETFIPGSGFLRDPKTGDLLRSPFMSGIVAFIFFGGALVGVAYGVGARTIKNDKDVMKGMGKVMSTLGSYMVLVFFAAQFVAFFNWTNLGLIVAVEGAEALKASGLGAIPLVVSFVFLSAFINLFMGSASAKWAVMAPVFVPMFMLLGYTPELTQAAYRIGDSATNIISPMMSYMALIIAFFERYDKKAGLGTVVATMLPYTTIFLIGWVLLLVVWMLLGLPVGPGAGLYLRP
jgi:aminobenzoyl-glutamate transport protein